MANLRTDNLCGEGGRNAYRGSVFFDGDNDYIDISNSVIAAAIPGGDEPYTIEMWVLFGRGGSTVDSGGSDSLIAYGSNSTRSYNGIDWTGTAIRNVWFGDDLSYTVDLTDGEWHHVAATYDQTTRRLFVDGNLGASDTPSDHSVGTTNNGKIGASTGGVINRDFKGYISNLRITKRAIYTAAFTPPTQELTAVDDTMLLCCQDSNDPNQEATGKTITGNGNLATAGYLGTQPKVIPPYGVDAGNTFNGAISMNTSKYMNFPTGRTEERGRGRAVVWHGVDSPNYTRDLDFFDIQSQGITTKFGEISDTVGLGAGMSSTTRGVFAGGTKPAVGNMNLLEFITIATTGNAIDFGSIGTLFRYGAGISNSTRGLIAGAYQGGGASGTKNVIQYITIANLGATADFGDIVANSGSGIFGAGSCSSSTRGITFGGGTGPSQVNEINYITIGTLGNSVDFGDLSAARYYLQGLSSSTRGVVAGGYQESPGFSSSNLIEFITIASTGDATDFGDLVTAAQLAGSSGGSNKIRGVFVGGGVHPSYYNTMEFITIATTGNASDFGDIRTGTPFGSIAVSDSHGGLS